MEEYGLPYIVGKTWTTDAVHRETREIFEKRKAAGCISVEMECSAVQAMCNFRGLEPYFFFTCGDLLDAPKCVFRLNGTACTLQREGCPLQTGSFLSYTGLRMFLPFSSRRNAL